MTSKLLFLLLFFLISSGNSLAQTGSTLQGSVTDDQGLALPSTTVTLTNTETGWTRTTVTNAEGWYRAAALPPGVYEIRAEID